MASTQVPPAINGSDSGSTVDNSNRSSRFRSWNIFRRGSEETFESASTMVELNSNLSVVDNANKEVKVEEMVDMDDSEFRTTDENEIENGAGGGSVVGMDMRGERPRGVETYKVVASLVCVVAGTGTLGMPHAVAQSGWLGTLVVLLALFMSTTTGNMLIECLYLKTNVRRTSYQEIAHDAYGKVGHGIAFGTVGVNLFGCAVLYVILAATLIQTMVSDMGHINEPVYIYIIGCAFFVWVCLIFTKTMKEVALLSIIGAGATIGVVMITVGVSADMIIDRASVTVSAAHKLVDWSKIPLSLATISFAYGGNVVYPHLEQTMRYPRSWSKALWIALTSCLCMYMSIAIAGYLAFGSDTMSPVLKNLPQGAWSAIANSLITLHVLLAAPILLTSLAMMVEACISARSPKFGQGTSRQQFLKRAIPRTIIILLVGFIASVIPFFGDVMDLLGALTTCLLVFVMPIMFYYRLGGMKTMRWWGQVWAWFIFLIGMVALVLGTVDATRHLIADFKHK